MRGNAVLLVGNLLIGGCVVPRAEESAIESFRFEIAGRPSLEVSLDDGSIEVLGTSSNEIHVRVTKTARAYDRKLAAAWLEELHIDTRREGDRVEVEIRRGTGMELEYPGISVAAAHVRSNVEIRVPRETNLTLITGDGNIEVEGVVGRVEARTSDGRLRFRDIEGTMRSRTSDGSIIGTDLVGDIDVSTADGRIELEGSFGSLTALTSDGSIKVHCTADCPSPTGDWVIRTTDGSISLILPSDFSAELEASTRDGRIINELGLETSHQSTTRLRGRLGRGGKPVLVRTSDGKITLRPQ